jgi:AcrR family transcriptional regulator
VTDLSRGKFQGRKPAGRYHHGDLQQALLDAASRLVERQGVATLSLRAVARELGVTHMAVYHHYRDRVDLLAAVATLGFERLGQALREHVGGVQDPGRAFFLVGEAYVLFAVAHPGFFRVMFSPELEPVRQAEPLAGTTAAAYAVFTDRVRAALPGRADTTTAATAAWALVHGLAVLLLERQLSPGPLPPGPLSPDAVRPIVRAVLREARIGADHDPLRGAGA